MEINRYKLEKMGFTQKDILFFSRITNKTSLPSSCTKSVKVNDAFRMTYHCDGYELVDFLARKIKKMQRGNIVKNKVFLEKLKKAIALQEAS